MHQCCAVTLLLLCSLPSLVFSAGAEWIDTKFENFPFMVNLRTAYGGHCGASIISTNPAIILTAAHCVWKSDWFDPMQIEVWIGCDKSDCSENPNAKRYSVSRYDVHEKCNYNGQNIPEYDVGLLYLNEAITNGEAISLLPSMDGINRGTALRALGYYGKGS